ncbi:hypothetical protein K1W54_04850 [Micromonospora sp. CPCC 205371]|nr:hypothetical protein [Micromonospora sp. CPCC 205371]
MALVISAAALVGAIVSFALTVALRPARPLSRKHRALLNDAAALIGRVRHPTRLDEIEVLSEPSQKAADQWLARYNREFE